MKFNRLENLIGSFSLEKLKESTVLVVGLGGFSLLSHQALGLNLRCLIMTMLKGF